MDKLAIGSKKTGDQLSSYEFNKIPDKINEVVDALNGSTSVQRNIYIQNNMEGKSFSSQKGEACVLNFTFVSQERYGYAAEYENTGERGLCKVYVKNSKYAEYTQVKQMYVNSNTPTTLDVADLLLSGANSVMLKVTGEVTGETTPAYSYTIQLTSLGVTAPNFKWWAAFTEDIIVPYIISGNIIKNLVVNVTGTDYTQQYTLNLGTSVYTDTAYNYTVPHPKKAGVFNISAYLTNSDGTIKTKSVSFNVMCRIAGDSSKLICVNNLISKATNWSENAICD